MDDKVALFCLILLVGFGVVNLVLRAGMPTLPEICKAARPKDWREIGRDKSED